MIFDIKKSSPNIFIYTFFGFSIPILFAIFLFNALVDPLWHFQGNLLRDFNYAYNERHMKLNAFVKSESDFDCILFGSSRATLLDVSKVKNYKCYNMSFSNGHIDEFISIANYIKNRNIQLKAIIFSINEVSFTPFYEPDLANLPTFIINGGRASVIKDYLSLSSLSFSYRTIRGRSPLPRAYKKMKSGIFSGFILSNTPAYTPSSNMTAHPELFKPYLVDNISKFRELLALFPDAESYAFIAPMSHWEQARLVLMGNLEKYVEIRYALNEIFTFGIVDFSLPSKLTLNTDITYDGLHYNEEINERIVDRLNSRDVDFGQQISELTELEYKMLVIPPINKFISDNNIKLAPLIRH